MKQSLSAAVAAFLALVGTIVVAWKLHTYAAPELLVSGWHFVVSAAVLTIIGWGMGTLLWLCSERRFLNLPWFALLSMGCAWIGGLALAQEVSTYQRQQQIDAEYAQRQEAIRAQRRAMREMIAEQRRLAEEFERDPFAAYERRLPPGDLEQLRGVEKAVLADFQDMQAEIESLMGNLEMTADEWLTSGDLERYRKARDQYREIAQVTARIADYLNNLGDTYQEKLDALDLSEEAERVGVAQKERLLQDPFFVRARKLRTLDAQMSSLARDVLDLFVKYPQQWHLNEDTGQVEFEHEDFERQVHWHLREILTLAEQQEKLEQEAEPAH
ncbi:MAG: hypothetical protein E1N59_1413 [Puniceicoccaceae bacterium 5H]|nr:MAG: hypothetical protein E1N59_1413 [Puniceicoccaceae bacterium 5H]